MTTDIIGCKKRCEIMNRPAYIVLFKGDDSDFEGNQSVDIVIDTELDTTGMKAHFRFMDFVQDFDSIPENKTLSLVFPNAKTSEFPLGAADATLRFEDASGKFRTVSNRIHIVVTNSVHEAYDNEDSQSITVTVKGSVTWEMIEGKPTFAPVATSGSYNDLSDKPTIPAPVTIDPALSPTSENPVQNKVVSKALYTGFTEWEISGIPEVVKSEYDLIYLSWTDMDEVWDLNFNKGMYSWSYSENGSVDDTYLVFTNVYDDKSGVTFTAIATRHLITPTKTSQLTNDGAPNGGGTPYATTAQIPDVTGKADKVLGATAGNLAALNAQGNLADSGAKVSDFATPSDLSYALVTPGEWSFSGLTEYATGTDMLYDTGYWNLYIYYDGETDSFTAQGSENDLVVAFEAGITATRSSLPGHLLDRANNLIDATTGNVTLTLPAYQEGKVRDLLVACTIGLDTNDDPWSVIFQGQGSEAPEGADEISFKAEGDDAASATFPVPDAAGDWWYSLTERAPHVFAVSLKQLQSVSQPTQTQGGS